MIGVLQIGQRLFLISCAHFLQRKWRQLSWTELRYNVRQIGQFKSSLRLERNWSNSCYKLSVWSYYLSTERSYDFNIWISFSYTFTDAFLNSSSLSFWNNLNFKSITSASWSLISTFLLSLQKSIIFALVFGEKIYSWEFKVRIHFISIICWRKEDLLTTDVNISSIINYEATVTYYFSSKSLFNLSSNSNNSLNCLSRAYSFPPSISSSSNCQAALSAYISSHWRDIFSSTINFELKSSPNTLFAEYFESL